LILDEKYVAKRLQRVQILAKDDGIRVRREQDK